MNMTLDNTPATDLHTACLVIGVFEHQPLTGSAKLIDQASNGEELHEEHGHGEEHAHAEEHGHEH